MLEDSDSIDRQRLQARDLLNIDGEIEYTNLLQFSGLSQNEVGGLRKEWHHLPNEERRKILLAVTEMAVEVVELDYAVFFCMCLEDDDEEIRFRALTGLWESDDRSIIGLLVDMLLNDTSERVRSRTGTGLGKFAYLAEEGKLLKRDKQRIQDVLITVIENPCESSEVRRRSMEAISCLNIPEVKSIILKAYNSDELATRCSAVFSMGKTCNTDWMTTIVKELENKEPSMRYEAANACGELGETALVPYLLPLIDDEDFEVQFCAISTLGIIGGSIAKNALADCLQSDDDVLMEAARAALNNLEANYDPMSSTFDL